MKQNRPAQSSVCCRPRRDVAERHLLEMVLAGEALHFDTGEQLDFRVGLDPLDQVLRHALGEIVAPDRDRDLAVALAEIDRGLPGGVAAADHEHRGAVADARLEVGRRVVDAGALEALEVLDGQPPVARAGGDDHRPGGDLAAVGEDDDVKARLAAQAGHFTGGVQPGAEPHRLNGGPPGESFAGDAVRKPRVVLDPRARAGLAADRHGVQRDRAQALRRAVDRGGEPGRAAADDDQIEHVARGRVERQPEVLGERRRRGAAQGLRGGDHRRDVLRGEPHAREQLVDVLGVLDVDPCVSQMRVLGERAQAHRLGRVARADDADRLGSISRAQHLAPREQRVEDRFGELRPAAHQAAKLGLADHEHPARLRSRGSSASGAGRSGGSARPRSHPGHRRRSRAPPRHQIGRPRLHPRARRTGRRRPRRPRTAAPRRCRPLGAECRDFRELGGAQVSKGAGVLIAAGS